MTKQEEIKRRLKSLEKKVDSMDNENGSDTSKISDLAAEYREIMDDYYDSLRSADIDFLLW